VIWVEVLIPVAGVGVRHGKSNGGISVCSLIYHGGGAEYHSTSLFKYDYHYQPAPLMRPSRVRASHLLTWMHEGFQNHEMVRYMSAYFDFLLQQIPSKILNG
jgi:hypothetical protein